MLFFFFGFFGLPDGFGSVGNTIAYGTASRFLDTGSKYEGFYESYLKIDGGVPKDYDIATKTKKVVDDPYGSFQGLKELTCDSGEKVQDIRRKSTVIMVSLKRKSCDGQEKTQFCK